MAHCHTYDRATGEMLCEEWHEMLQQERDYDLQYLELMDLEMQNE